QHDRCFRKGARHRGGLCEMPERHPQIPGQSVFVEQRKAAQPALVLHGPRHARLDTIRRRRSDRFRADTAHQRAGRLRGDDFLSIVRVEPGMRDDGAGKAVLRVDLAEPAGFAELVGAIPFGLAMHGRQDVMAGSIAPVIRRQIILLERSVVAHEERLVLGAAQPGVLAEPQIPQMMMRVDQRDRLRRGVPMAVDRFMAGLHRRAAYVYKSPILYTKALRCEPMSRSMTGY